VGGAVAGASGGDVWARKMTQTILIKLRLPLV
jgi:hypothetical protein